MSVFSPGQGRRCRFRLADVVCPERRQALMQITADLEVSGEIAFLSDQGEQPDGFAIIDVEGVLSPLIVPVGRLELVPQAGLEQKKR